LDGISARPARRDARAATGAAAAKSRAGEVELGALKHFVGFNLRLAQDVSFRAFARDTGQHGLRPGRFAAMMVLRDNPGITQSALGRAIARDKSTISPLLHDLQKRGLVRRAPSPSDRRSVTLSLTPAGEAALRELIGHARRHDDKLDAIVGAGKAEFLRLLRKITDELG